MSKLLVFVIATLWIFNGLAQGQFNADSLEAKLLTIRSGRIDGYRLISRPTDTIEANILFTLARIYTDNNPHRAMELTNQCLAISQHTDYKRGIGNAYNSFGSIYFARGDYPTALQYYKYAFKIREEIGDKEGLAATYNNFGIVYSNIGNYPEALTNYFIALKMNVESGNKQWQAYNLINIGLIYYNLQNYPEALINFKASLDASEQIGDKSGIALAHNCIGELYKNQHDDKAALKSFYECLKISKEEGFKDLTAMSYASIGAYYKNQHRFHEALESFCAALQIYLELGAKDGIAELYNLIGTVYAKERNFVEAKRYLMSGMMLSKDVGKVENLKDNYEGLSLLASAEGDFSKALKYYKLFIVYRDSLLNQVNTKKITQQQMQYDFDSKEVARIAAQEKKDVFDRVIFNVLIGGVLTMTLFSAIFVRQRNVISKGKKKSDELLLNILPPEVADELKNDGKSEARQYNNVSVLFTDFVNFTGISEQMTPEELVAEIHQNFTAFDGIMEKHGLEKIKTIGDAYLAVSGLPIEHSDHAQRAAAAALDIQQYMEQNHGKFQIRMGIHSGPVVAGIVGVKKYAFDIWGDTVNTAARMEQNSEAGKINISAATYELIKNDFTCEYRGKIKAKNKGEIDMYFVTV